MDFKVMASNLGFDKEDFLELAELLVTVSTADLAALEEGLAQNSSEKVVQAAHSIKGAAGNLGFVDIAAIAASMESFARQGELDTIKISAETLRQGLFSIKQLIDRS